MKAHVRLCSKALVVVAAMLVIMILAIPPGRAAGPWYVAPGGDDGHDCLSPASPCATMNGAIAKASLGDTIYVAIGTYTGTGDEVVLLDKDATLSGGWDDTFTTQSGTSTIDGEGSRRGVTLIGGITAVGERFVVRNGYSDYGGGISIGEDILTLKDSTISDNTCNKEGGGIYIWYGSLTLHNCTVSGNRAIDSRAEGGGIRNYRGTLTLNNSTVGENIANDRGGGIDNYDGTATLYNTIVSGNTAVNEGGGIKNALSTLTVNTSTISSNAAGDQGGGIFNWSQSSLTLNESSVSGNTARNKGGGIFNEGDLALNNSTVNGNIADIDGGGIYQYGTAALNSGTMSGNFAYSGGGIRVGYGTTILQNTVIARNTAVSDPDCSGSINSAGYNLIGNASGCTFTPGPGDLTDVDPQLGPFEGSPGYHPLLWGSPAINAGNPAGCTDHLGNPLLTDQRGKPRIGHCDIGAYEVTALHFSSKTANSSTTLPGEPLTYTVSLNNIESVDVKDIWVTDTVPISLTWVVDSLTADSGRYGYSSGVITWTGSVRSSDAVKISFGVTVSETVPKGTTITNSVVISGGWEVITRTAPLYVGKRIYLPIVLKSGG